MIILRFKKLISAILLTIASNPVQTYFISKQKGFIKRELIKKNEIEYADLIHRQSKQDAEKAGN